MNGLMTAILEDQIRCHVIDPEVDPPSDQTDATEQLVDLVRGSLK